MASGFDPELLERFKRGDKEAFNELIFRHQRAIYSLAYRIIGDEKEAREITQQVFVNAYRGLLRFKEKSEVKTWLYRITINLCKNYFRSNPCKREVDLEDLNLSQTETPLSQLLKEEEKMRLKMMLDSLPEKQRITLILRIYQELSYKEIASIMKSAEGTVKANIFHGLKRLRSMLRNGD